MRLSTDDMRVFLAVLDHGSFSAAARHLGRVPSAVSMAIAQLEAALDLPLFDRGARQPVPTSAARALEPQARQLMSQLGQIEAHALALHRGLEKRLVLAIAPELLSGAWTAPLAVLAGEFPHLEVAVRSAPQTDALRMLHAGEADLAIVFERPAMDEREVFQEFARERFTAVIARLHPLAGPHTEVGLEDLLDVRQVVVAGRATEALDPRFVYSRHVWRTDSHLATLGLVLAGLGWAYLPHALVQPHIAAGSLAPIAFHNISNELWLWADLVWNRERPLGLGAKRYIALMREAWQSTRPPPGR